MPSAEYQRAWKKRNPEKMATMNQKRREIYKEETKDDGELARKVRRVREGKRARKQVMYDEKGGCCVDCGETDIRVMEFDHITGTKTGVPCKLSVVMYFTEVREHCEMVCANCHRIRTWERNQERITKREN